MTIQTDFACYIEGILAESGIHKATSERYTSDLRRIAGMSVPSVCYLMTYRQTNTRWH